MAWAAIKRQAGQRAVAGEGAVADDEALEMGEGDRDLTLSSP